MNKIELFLDILDEEEFLLTRYNNGKWGLQDLQCANIGGICNQYYTTITQILDRMEIYHDDYFANPVAEYFGIDDYTNYGDLVAQCREKLYNDKEDEFFGYSEHDLQILEFIATAPLIDICNKPLEEIKHILRYEELESDYYDTL